MGPAKPGMGSGFGPAAAVLAVSGLALALPLTTPGLGRRSTGSPKSAMVSRLRLKHFHVTVYQRGIPVQVKNDAITLRRSPFALAFDMVKPCSVWVNASFDGALYRRARKGADLSKIFTPYHIGADFDFNPHRQIFVSAGVPALSIEYWKIVHNHYFVETTKKHRCDQATVSRTGCSCKRTIANLWQGTARTPIARVNRTPLYLVFYKARCDKGESRCVEEKRLGLVIHFR